MTKLKNVKRRDKVYCLKNDTYIKGVVQEIGQDEADRWGDKDYWVKLSGDTNKYYVVYTPAEYIERLNKDISNYENDIRGLKLEIKDIRNDIQITYKLKEEFYNEN
jgi:hypothetical protein